MRTGYFYGLMSDIAATVSVAQMTALSIMIYLRERRDPKMRLLMTKQKVQMRMKPMMVPTTPRNMIVPKFSKKRDFLSE